MFRDRDEELERLNRQLLEEENEKNCEEEEEYEDSGEYEDEYEEESDPQPDYNAYNADSTDVDLEEFCCQLDESPRKPTARFVAVFFFLGAIVLLVLAFLLAHHRGLL